MGEALTEESKALMLANEFEKSSGAWYKNDVFSWSEEAETELRRLAGVEAELQQAREERTAWRVTAENAEAAVKQARIDALEEAAAICKANAAMCSEGVMRLTLEANAAAIESLKGTP